MKRLAPILIAPFLFLPACGEPSSAAAHEAPVHLDALLAANKLDEVVAYLQPLFDAGELSAADSDLLARVRISQNELPKAVKILKTTLERKPEATAVSVRLSSVYQSIGLQDKALETLLSARAAGGTDLELALVIGIAKGRLGDLEGARAEFLLARAAGANAADIDYNLALIEMDQENYAEAEEALKRLLAADPTRVSVRRELAHAELETGTATPEQVRDEMNRVLEEDPEDWRAWELLADAEMKLGDYLAAKAYYTSALEFGTKELGNNPPRVETKYVAAAEWVQDIMRADGMLPPEPDASQLEPPPFPVGVQERQREAKIKALEEQAAEEAASKGSEGASDGI
ncbi:MAG: putative Zn-dependent protease [Gammaproteobacteria bacterium]|jgi:predicted Zn-dependent protease